ncbi:hypothetical protein V1511DRAFT_491395 [Dipodascopsis uninucleata]
MYLYFLSFYLRLFPLTLLYDLILLGIIVKFLAKLFPSINCCDLNIQAFHFYCLYIFVFGAINSL